MGIGDAQSYSSWCDDGLPFRLVVLINESSSVVTVVYLPVKGSRS